jgi:hypothetical protein
MLTDANGESAGICTRSGGVGVGQLVRHPNASGEAALGDLRRLHRDVGLGNPRTNERQRAGQESSWAVVVFVAGASVARRPD